MTITHRVNGGRTIELFVPFRYGDGGKRRVRSVTLSPLTLGHVFKWQKGEYKDIFDLMVELSGGDPELMRQIRYPDADRVLAVFFEMLTPEIQENARSGMVPKVVQKPESEATVSEPESPPVDDLHLNPEDKQQSLEEDLAERLTKPPDPMIMPQQPQAEPVDEKPKPVGNPIPELGPSPFPIRRKRVINPIAPSLPKEPPPPPPPQEQAIPGFDLSDG